MTDEPESLFEKLLNKHEPKSNTYVIASACIAAIILGLTMFLLVRAFQWRAGLAALRAEPGIEILSIKRAGFFKKQLFGLKDPLAPTAESILEKHNIGPHRAIITLTEYHSLNTPYARQREEKRESEFRELKETLMTAVGDFASTLTEQRETDIEKITQMLFDAKFPEEMKTVEIRREDGNWIVEGELYKPILDDFMKEAPGYLVDGELISENLGNRTESRLSSLREEIHATDLSKRNLDGELVNVERIQRLIRDFDKVCDASLLPLPRIRLESNGSLSNREAAILDEILDQIVANDGISKSRFLPSAVETGDKESPAIALRILQIAERN